MSSAHSRAAISMARNLGVIDGKTADALHELDEEAAFDALDAGLTAYHEKVGSSDETRSNMYNGIFAEIEEFDGWW